MAIDEDPATIRGASRVLPGSPPKKIQSMS